MTALIKYQSRSIKEEKYNELYKILNGIGGFVHACYAGLFSVR